MPLRRFVFACLALWGTAVPLCAKPVLYIIGDSTVRNGTAGQMGWGDPLIRHFAPVKIDVINRAIGGRSSRTFLTEGRWDAVMANLKAGDFVLIQFGHNDGGALNDSRCRASLRGIGDESEKIVRQTDGREETVRTFGWYLGKYIRDARSRGAVPIVVSPIPRNLWQNGGILREAESHAAWSRQVAAREQAAFIDFNDLLAGRYDALGKEQTALLFSGEDHTHTNATGADFNATVMAEAIRSLAGCQLGKGLLPGDLWLPRVFSDHMVLQRDVPLPVWGTAHPGEEVAISLGASEARTKADAGGQWRVDLPGLATGGPFTLEVASKAVSHRITDVMCGEVWLWVGQADANGLLSATDSAQLRVFSAEVAMREYPQQELAGRWAMPVRGEHGGSGAACEFGRLLQQQLKAPVGLIVCTADGGAVESWIRRETLEAHPQFGALLKDYGRKQIEFRDHPNGFEEYGRQLSQWRTGPIPHHPDPVQHLKSPAVLYNGMIAPIVPYALHGVRWSQSGTDACQILADDLRALWQRPQLMFRAGKPSDDDGGLLNHPTP